MALTRILRHRAPLDGSWFPTTASLNSLLRAVCLYDDDMTWPKMVDDVRVPVFVRMETYLAQVTPRRPDGMMFGPVVRIGTMDSPDAAMFGHHHACGLFNDYQLDRDDPDNKWLYTPHGGNTSPPGEDVSVYRCDLCNNHLYRDDPGRRHDRSACLFDGALVCRDCEVTGLAYDQEVDDRLIRCRTLADFLGTECRRLFDRRIERLSGGFSFSNPSQTRLFNDGE